MGQWNIRVNESNNSNDHTWPLHKNDMLFQSGRPMGLNIYFTLIFSDASSTRRFVFIIIKLMTTVKYCNGDPVASHYCIRFEVLQ